MSTPFFGRDALAVGASRVEVAAFGYHEVTDDPTTSGFQRAGARPFTLSRAAFSEHLAQIAGGPVRPELVADLDLTRPGRHLLLTFDDGGKSAVHASEELSRRGWRAHFFVVTGRIGTRTFLDVSEIRHIRSCGHLIGSHSHTHPDIFREQSLERMIQEWRVSCDHLSQILGESCTSASVPGGHISPSVLRAADAADVRHLFTCEPTLIPRLVGDCWVFGRVLAKVHMPARRVGELARFHGWRRAMMLRHVKEFARRGLPSLFRLYMRRRTREPQRGE